MATSPNSNVHNIVIEKNPSDVRLSELGINSWPKWGCPAGRMKLKYEARETCYFVKGKVKAYPNPPKAKGKGKAADDFVEFGAGDLVIIPPGLCCIWDVSLPVDKFYKFDPL